MKKIEKDFLDSFDEKLDADLSFKDAYDKSKINFIDKKKTPFYKKPSILVSVACLLIVIIATSILVPNVLNNKDNIADIPTSSFEEPSISNSDSEEETPGASSGDTAVVLPWNEKTYIQKYPVFNYKNGCYMIYSTEKSKPIKDIYVKEKISDIEVKGFDIYENKEHIEQAEIFKIDKVDESFSLAIKFKDDLVYYSYQNFECKFEDVNDFLVKTDFKNSVEFKNAVLNGNGTLGKSNKIYRFDDFDKEILFNYLLSDLDSKNIYLTGDNKLAVFSVRMVIEKIGLDMNPLAILEDYSIRIILNNVVFNYKIPFEKIKGFIDYLIENVSFN